MKYKNIWIFKWGIWITVGQTRIGFYKSDYDLFSERYNFVSCYKFLGWKLKWYKENDRSHT